MGNFQLAYSLTMGFEGGYANDPDDTGGETWAGISRVSNPAWPGWVIVDAVKATRPASLNAALRARADLTAAVHDCYQVNYWDVNRLSQINSQAIAEQLFDIGVNMGVKIAARFLQEALNMTNVCQTLTEDGIIGNGTISAVNAHPKPLNVLKLIVGLKIERYMNICRKNPTQKKFMNSWLSRVPLAA